MGRPTDGIAAELDAEVDGLVASPLTFAVDQVEGAKSVFDPEDIFGPTLSGPNKSPSHFNRHAPPPAGTVELQLGTVTARVQHLEIEPAGDDNTEDPTPPRLFKEITPALLPQAMLPQAKLPRSSAPPKTRSGSAPVRQSARQAGAKNSVPVAQRAGGAACLPPAREEAGNAWTQGEDDGKSS